MQFSLYGFLIGLATVSVWSIFEFFLKQETAAKKWPERTWSLGLGLIGASTLIGARAYHVITDWSLYSARPWPAVLAVWNGGLGWYGGVLGVIIGLWIWRKWQHPAVSWTQILDSFALAIPWGQALGRWGNYFNQELFGPPTTLPWGVYIQERFRPEIWQGFERFHPLFLYESLGSLLIGFVLFYVWRRGKRSHSWRVGSGIFVSIYAVSFGILRGSIDFLRTDLDRLSGLTVSQWVSLMLILGGGLFLVRTWKSWTGKAALSLGIVIGAFTVLAVPAQAQLSGAPVDLSLTPAVVEIVIKPGATVTRAFTLKNKGTEDLNAVLTLRDFVSDNTTGAPVMLESSSFPYASLINSDRQINEPFSLPANGEQQLVLSLNIPEDAPQQDWYLVFLINTEPKQRDPLISSRASSQGSIGATLLIRISDTESIPLQWGVTFPTLPRFFDSLRPLKIEPLVENINPTMAVPNLIVTVRNWRGEIVHSQDGLPERVLSRSTRIMRGQKESLDDPRSLEPTDFIFDPIFALGPYTVEATITNQAGQPLVVTQKVWAWPISLVIGLFVLVILLRAFSLIQSKNSARKTV